MGTEILATPRSDKPWIFVCCGLHGSGSTWMFNLVREIYRTEGVEFVSCHRESKAKWPLEGLGSRRLVVKSHNPMADLQSFIANSSEPVVITVRDPRDAVVSMMQRFPDSSAADFNEALKAVALSAQSLVALSRLRDIPVFRYEDGFIGSVETFDRIAALLGTRPPKDHRTEILAGLTQEAVKRKISDLEAAGAIRGEEVWDRESQWHANHVGDGKVGKFNSVLSPAQQREIVRQTRDYCDRFGYDVTANEMRETEAPLTAPSDAVPTPRSGKPRFFFCCGQHGSGSTWMFNLVREICRTQGVDFVSCHQESRARLPLDNLGSRLLVVKAQNPTDDLQLFIGNSSEPAVIMVRDPRDAVASFMLRFPNSLASSFDKALEAIALSAQRLVALSRLRDIPVFRYEDGFVGSVETFDRIAALLGTSPSEDHREAILAGLTPEAVRRTISGLEAAGAIRGEEVWDRETHWHANHVGDGKVGKFNSVLSPAQQREVVKQTRDYCDRFGYDVTVNEMRETEAPLTAPSDAVPVAAAEATQPVPDQGQATATQRRDADTKTVGLCMIVKNEAPVIRRCLDSVRPLLDYVLVEDTGSTDGTQDIIRDWLTQTGLPGEVFDAPWQDFAHNRTLALARLRENSAIDYALIIDADDALEIPQGFQLPELTADSYTLDIHDTSIHYQRTQIVRNTLPWRYQGVLHEFLVCEGSGPAGRLPIVMRRGHDGARRRDPETYRKDASILESALLTETDPFLIARYTFYLAQSYRDCGEKAKAIEAYLRRAELGYWDQEVFFSLYKAAQLKEELGHDKDEVIALYLRASESAPNRAEALHGASRLCRNAGRNRQGYEIAKRGLALTAPKDGLFVEPWIYETGLLDEFAVNAYWSGRYRDCLDASLKILATGKLSGANMQRVVANVQSASKRLPREPNLGSLGKEGFIEQLAIGAPRSLRTRLDKPPRVLVAILAKQKEPSLPLYLECIEALDYPKSSMFLYIRTNNNTDRTEQILREWVARVGHLYADVEFDSENVAAPVQNFGVHEWNAVRFSVLGRIRNISLRRALEHDCEFYFVADVDNFVRPCTLRELVALNLPIVAPLLRSIGPGNFYSNYHAEIDANGYYKECDQYQWILNRWVRGVLEMPLVHCTYLIRADVLNDLTYEDATSRYEYVVFSDSARKSGVPQYLDNRQIYGYITFDKGDSHYVTGGIEQARTLLCADLSARAAIEDQARKPAIVSPAAGPLPDRPGTHTGRLKTLIFCTSFAETREEWNGRYRRWLQAIRASELVYDNILIVDDGSPVLPDWRDVEVRTDEIGDAPPTDLLLYHFREHLGRKDVFDFPGWYRSFAFAGRYAQAHDFGKVIHIESDSFLIGSRVQRYFNDAVTGWIALWCPLYSGYPETAIQVMAGDAVRRFAGIERTHPHESLIGREFELQLPFDVVEKRFNGNRFGEYLPFVPGNAEYAVQVPSDLGDDYYWWLHPGYRDSRVGDPGPAFANMKTAPQGIPAMLEQVNLINLDRSPDRLARVKERNSHLKNILRVPAVDGALADREELVKDGTITEDLSYLPGALGCAVSHVGLWKKAVSLNGGVTVCEDDVIFSFNFLEESARVISSLPADWDIIHWGYLFDPYFLWVDFGFAKAELRFYDRRFSRDYQKFQCESSSSTAVRLVHSFGLQAYSVSPKGARALLEYCLPLRKRLIPFPGTDIVLEDIGIDCAMCGAYGSMQAFVCIPPLVIHDDVQTSDRIARDQA